MYAINSSQAVVSTDLVTISMSDLRAVTGGNDPGVDFTNELYSNLVMQGNHELATVDAVKKGDWGNALKEGITSVYDMGHTTVAAAKHASGLWDFTKDVIDTASKIIPHK